MMKSNLNLYAGPMFHVGYIDQITMLMRMNVHRLHVELMKEVEKTKTTLAEVSIFLENSPAT